MILARRAGVRRLRSIGFVAVLAAVLAVAYTSQAGFPLPHIHDEFSYLLAGEMFAHGRVSMPAPPSPEHFATIHELIEPRYASKYPPAQGLVLAIGIGVFNDARIGVWLSFAMLGAVLTWMLHGWVRSPWTLLPALWTILLVASTPWTYTYWGGSVAAVGGALVFGAVGRLGRRHSPRTRDAIVLALGLLVLANSRPFEGLLTAIPVAGYVAWWLRRGAGDARTRWRRVAFPVACVLLAGGAGILGYNQAVTGDAFSLPHAAYERQQGGASPFVWGDIAELRPDARVPDRERWLGDVEKFNGLQTVVGYREVIVRRFLRTLGTLLPLFAAFPLLLLPWAVPGALIRTAVASVALVSLGIATLSWFEVQYVAPAVGALLLVYVHALRMLRVRLVRRWGRIGRLAVGSLVLALFGEGLLRFITPPVNSQRWASPNHWTRRRSAMIATLEATKGRHAIFVRYDSTYGSANEWVYNGYDLDGAKVLWVNDLGDARNAELLKHADRTGWRVALDSAAKPELTRYAPPQARLTKEAATGLEAAERGAISSTQKKPASHKDGRTSRLRASGQD